LAAEEGKEGRPLDGKRGLALRGKESLVHTEVLKRKKTEAACCDKYNSNTGKKGTLSDESAEGGPDSLRKKKGSVPLIS